MTNISKHRNKITVSEVVNSFKDEVNNFNIINIVEEISKYHRIQASPEYRKAAKSCINILNKEGVNSYIDQYKAELGSKAFTYGMFKEWSCNQGILNIQYPFKKEVANFLLDDMSIIQRSKAIDFSALPRMIVYVSENDNPETYNEDLTGKIMFVENNFDIWIETAIRLHAEGIITVSMPEIEPVRVDIINDPIMSKKRANLSFKLNNKECENKLFGFVLTPSDGNKLKEECIKLKKENKYPTATGFVHSELYDGSIENVVAQIKGKTDEEVLMVAHLCHPKSSVNDNVSGVASGIAAINIIQKLINKKIIPEPKRSIKLILVPEFTGTYSFLASNEDKIKEIKAGLNLDMVGAAQDENAGAMLIIKTPDSMPSFVNALSNVVMKEVSKECYLSGNGNYTSLFNWEIHDFMLGSDHYILSDPTINIPTVALTQWPDKTYHTSADNIDHISEKMLKRASVFSATYIYLLSILEEHHLGEILTQMREDFFIELNKLFLRKGNQDEAEYLLKKNLKAYNSINEFFVNDGAVASKIENEKLYLEKIKSLFYDSESVNEKLTRGRVPKRLFKGPLAKDYISNNMTCEIVRKYKKLKSDFPNQNRVEDFIIYNIDGENSEEVIALNVLYETQVECLEYVTRFIDILVEAKLVKIL